MAKKIDNKTYPDKIGDVLKDKDFLEVVENWAKDRDKVAADMLMCVQTNMEPDRFYEHFLKKGARHPISVDATLRKAMEKLASEDDFENKIWKHLLIPNTKKACLKTLEDDSLPRFFKSAEFKLHHNPDVKGSSAKVAKLLGVENDDTLKDLMTATALGREQDVKTLSAKLIDKHKVKESKTFVSRMKKAMGL